MSVTVTKWIVATVICTAFAMTTGCVTSTVSRHVAKDGSGAEAIIFPDARNAHPKGGIFPTADSLRNIAPGMTKAQVQSLIGSPHFKEGIWHVREWDYLFNFHKNGRVVVCQYKLLFDENQLVGSVHWRPTSCADLLEQMKPKTVDTASRPYSGEILHAYPTHVLFDFGSAYLTPQGRERLTELQHQLHSDVETQDIHVVGYADRIGSDGDNLLLSLQRAETVRNFLVANGIDASAIRVDGRGNTDPIVACADGEHRNELIVCLAPNRRVELSGIVKP